MSLQLMMQQQCFHSITDDLYSSGKPANMSDARGSSSIFNPVFSTFKDVVTIRHSLLLNHILHCQFDQLFQQLDFSAETTVFRLSQTFRFQRSLGYNNFKRTSYIKIYKKKSQTFSIIVKMTFYFGTYVQVYVYLLI